MQDFILGDFETASACDLKKCGAWRYAEDPTTEILCYSFGHVGERARTWTPWLSADHPITRELYSLVVDREVTWVAHNAGFEKAIWRRLMVAVHAWPDIPNSRWDDTMATCAMKVLPLDLDRACLVLRLPVQKDMEGSRLTKSLSKPRKDGSYDRTPETLARVATYCEQDIDAEGAVLQSVGRLPPGERSVWLLDQRVNERGVLLDLEYIRAAQEVVHKASVPLVKEFEILTGVRPTQRDKIMGWLKARGVQLPDMTKATLARVLGAEEDDEDASFDDDGDEEITLPPECHRALHIRQLVGSASIKKLARMDACVGSDGRARGLLQYHGAGPGRWSGRLFQPQNFPRGTIQIGSGVDRKAPPPQMVVDTILTCDPEYIEAVLGPAIEVVVHGLRHAIIAKRKHKLLSGDFSTIELRVNLGLAGQHDKLDMLAKGLDPYVDMAEKIYKCPVDKKRDPEKRQTGKNSVLGLGFQMGAPKFRMKYASAEPMEFCQEVVRIFRKEWAPLVPSNWYDLEAAAVRAVHDRVPKEAHGITYQLEDQWLTARLPSGRKLWYFNPRPCRKATPWDPTDIRLAWTYQAMKKGQMATIDAYGGLLTENVVQATARDLMVSAMFKCENNGLPVILTNHDEIVCEPEDCDADELALKQIMCDIPQWAKAMAIPIATETWAGDRYRK